MDVQLHDSCISREFIKFQNNLNQTINDIQNVINDKDTKCKIINYKIYKLTDNIRISIYNFDQNKKCDYIAFHSIHIKKADTKYIDKLVIKIGGTRIWSFNFNFLMTISKYRNDILYFPDDLLFENNIFFPLILICYHEINIYFTPTDEYKSKSNMISCDNIIFNFIGMTKKCDSMTTGIFKIHEYNDNYCYRGIRDSKFRYHLNFLSTNCIYVKAKGLTSAKLNLIDPNMEIECIVTRPKINHLFLNLNSNYKTVFQLKIPFDIIKHILSYLLSNENFYLIQFNKDNTYLELQRVNKVEIILNVEPEFIVGIERNLLHMGGGMGGKLFSS